MADFGYSSRVVKCDRDHMACKAQHVYYLAFHNKSWPTSKLFHVSPLRSEWAVLGSVAFIIYWK